MNPNASVVAYGTQQVAAVDLTSPQGQGFSGDCSGRERCGLPDKGSGLGSVTADSGVVPPSFIFYLPLV